MALKNNLRMWREAAAMSRETLAELVGVSPVSIYRIELGQQQPRPNLLGAIAAVFRKLPGEFYSEREPTNVEHAVLGARRIPVLDYVQAGKWTGVDVSSGVSEMRETIATDLDHPPSAFAMRIRGNSMEPLFHESDIVVIAPTLAPQPGDFVVATDETGEATFKQYRLTGINEKGQTVFELHPLNPHYAPLRSDRQPVSIVGTMVEHRRYRKR